MCVVRINDQYFFIQKKKRRYIKVKTFKKTKSNLKRFSSLDIFLFLNRSRDINQKPKILTSKKSFLNVFLKQFI